MGRQGGISLFMGSFGNVNCYFDDGRALARMKSSLTKARWLDLPSMAAQRAATRGFGAASVIASQLWGMLPAGMRRLGDGGAFNRLVGACRELVCEDGQLWDADLLRGLNLCAGSLGPHRVAFDIQRVVRVLGMDLLLAEIAAAESGTAGMMVARIVMAKGVPREAPHGATTPRGVAPTLAPTLRGNKKGVQRRFRVWVHAARVVEMGWDALQSRYAAVDSAAGNGCVSPWMVDSGEVDIAQSEKWLGQHRLPGMDWLRDDLPMGTYVVFSGVEVAEKRGRHWVRLPWCCKLLVHHVVEVAATGKGRAGVCWDLDFLGLGLEMKLGLDCGLWVERSWVVGSQGFPARCRGP